GLDAEGLDAVDIHEGRVERGDPARVVVGLLGCALDDGVHVGLRPVAEHHERAVLRAILGDLVCGQPTAVDVREQVILRAYVGVDPGEVDAGAGRVRRERHHSILPKGGRGRPFAVDGYGFAQTGPEPGSVVLAC